MSAEKLSSDEVPQKFVKWLLDMGCPAEKLPSVEKMTGMCRGQYYLVWRSLMEHVQAKNVIRHKRLTVFNDDIKKSLERKLLDETDSSASLPEPLSLWKLHSDLREKVKDIEACVGQSKIILDDHLDKISSRVIQRNSLRRRIEDLYRRTWLLSKVSNELTATKTNLEEARSIADSLCNFEREQHGDVKEKLDKYVTMQQRKGSPVGPSLSTPIASSSIMSNHENESTHCDKDDIESSLSKCCGDILWPHLHAKRVLIDSRLSQAYTNNVEVGKKRSHIWSLLAYTRGLHSSIALEALKKKGYFKRIQAQIAEIIENLNTYNATEDAFEFLVMKCQRAYSETKLKSLEASLEELTSRRGVFDCGGDHVSPIADKRSTPGKIAAIDKCIMSARDEIIRLITSLESTDRKICNTRECLLAVFNALHNNTAVRNTERCTGVQMNFPTESIPMLRNFYAKGCETNKHAGNISLDLDMSDSSYADTTDPKFIDELKLYLKKFNLERNRKLVLDSGEKIWVFETLKYLSSTLYNRWISDDVTPLLCPSVRTSRALQLLHDPQNTDASILEELRAKYTCSFGIDVTSLTNHEADAADNARKRISENLIILHKIQKSLDICDENLHFWSQHQLKQYISTKRTIADLSFKEYEAIYSEMFN